MGAKLLLHTLQAQGVLVSLTPEGKIRVEAHEGALDDRLRQQIRQERDGLVALLHTFARDEERERQVPFFASPSPASSPSPVNMRAMRTQNPQVCTPILVSPSELWNGGLAPVSLGLPDQWRLGLERLALMPPPISFTDKRWALGVRQARQIALDDGPAACVMGWSAEDLFGLHLAAPAARYDGMGLAFLLRETCRIVSLDHQRALIQNSSGSKTTYWRGRCSPESRPAWELLGHRRDRAGP
jgi:hypothetical protein